MNHFFDLEAHEMLRQAAVLEACDGLYDPTQVAADEAEARVLLYSGLRLVCWMLDPAADAGCRVWTTCPKCLINDPDGCYMIGYSVGDIWAQCAYCETRFWFQTNFGVGPDVLDPDWF